LLTAAIRPDSVTLAVVADARDWSSFRDDQSCVGVDDDLVDCSAMQWSRVGTR
jgi:hypothetical protein